MCGALLCSLRLCRFKMFATPPKRRFVGKEAACDQPPATPCKATLSFADRQTGAKPNLDFRNNPVMKTPNRGELQLGYDARGQLWVRKLQNVRGEAEADFAFNILSTVIHNPVENVPVHAFCSASVRGNAYVIETVYKFAHGKKYFHAEHSVASNMVVYRLLREALESLHILGMTHNDVKPDNIVVDVDETGAVENAWLIDLGCSPGDSPVEEMTLSQKSLLASLGKLTPAEKDVFNLNCFCGFFV